MELSPLTPSSLVRFRENFSKPETLFYKTKTSQSLIRYFTKKKKFSDLIRLIYDFFFFLGRPAAEKKQKFHGTTKDLGEMATSTIFFSFAAAKKKKKVFSHNKRIWESWQRALYIFSSFGFSSALFGLLLVCAMFSKKFSLRVSFFLL